MTRVHQPRPRDLDERVRHRLVRIERACQQSIELTQALLHLARDQKADAETGEVHSMEDIVDQVVEFHRPQLANKPVDVDVKILEPLNDAQREAVASESQNLLVLAGAGSGKTRVLVHRIAWLIQAEGLSPWSILAVTFTNKAAREMRLRIEEMLQILCDTQRSMQHEESFEALATLEALFATDVDLTAAIDAA